MGYYKLNYYFDSENCFDLEEYLFSKDIYLYRRLFENYRTYLFVIDEDIQTLIKFGFILGRFPYQINISEISKKYGNFKIKMYDKWFIFNFNSLWRVLRAMKELKYINLKIRKEIDTDNEDIIYYLDIKVITDLINTRDLKAIENEHNNNTPYTDILRFLRENTYPIDKRKHEEKIYDLKTFHKKDKSIKTSMKIDFQVEDFHYEAFDDELIFYHDISGFHCLQIPSINL